MSRRAFILAAAALICSAGSPVLASPPAPMWSGAYIGGFAGLGWANWSGDLTKYPGSSPASSDFGGDTFRTITGSGELAGGDIGFAMQNNGFVWGLEGDISSSGISGSGLFNTINFGAGNPAGASQQVFYKDIQTNIDWLATVRARLGVLVQPDTLLYGTGGFAGAGTSSTQDVYFDGGNGMFPYKLHATGSDKSTQWGWTVGAGVERKLDSHWSVKAEYLYANLGQIDYHYIGTHTGYPYGNTPGSVHDTDGFSPTLIVQTLRVGINYKFGG